jgi:hypothetical protein
MEVTVRSDSEASTLACRLLINSAGLHAVALLSRIESYPARAAPSPYLAKGNYFAYRGGKPFSRLVYPLPNDGLRRRCLACGHVLRRRQGVLALPRLLNLLGLESLGLTASLAVGERPLGYIEPAIAKLQPPHARTLERTAEVLHGCTARPCGETPRWG